MIKSQTIITDKLCPKPNKKQCYLNKTEKGLTPRLDKKIKKEVEKRRKKKNSKTEFFLSFQYQNFIYKFFFA